MPRKTAQEIENILNSVCNTTFNVDLAQNLAARNYRLVILGINSKTRKFLDLSGKLEPANLVLLNLKFADADAGYKVNIKTDFPAWNGMPADVFLINKDHLAKAEQSFVPLVTHELCHFIVDTGQIGLIPIDAIDRANADAIYESLTPGLHGWHSKDWCAVMAWAARKRAGLPPNTQSTVKSFLQLAIPDYDRPNWGKVSIREGERAQGGPALLGPTTDSQNPQDATIITPTPPQT